MNHKVYMINENAGENQRATSSPSPDKNVNPTMFVDKF